MKTYGVIVAFLMLVSSSSLAQFKSQVPQETQVSIGNFGDDRSPLSYLFGWFNPEKFSMHHSFDMSYATFGGNSLSLGTYTNTMLYEFADNFNARADVAFSFSPYNNLSQFGKNDFSKIYLKNAEVNYKPWDNTQISVSFRQDPYGYGYYSPFHNPWYGYNGFNTEKK